MATRPQSPRARRWGYGIAALINLIVAWGVNIWPGWDAVPFLTSGPGACCP